MNLREAIEASLEFERKIRAHYKESAEKAGTEPGRKFYSLLAREEDGHVSYLKKMDEEYGKTGSLPEEPLSTLFTRTEWVIEGGKAMNGAAGGGGNQSEMDRLLTALRLEEEATKLYEKLVLSLGPEGGKFFGQFLKIEEAHTALVRAEVDYFNRSGYFYDFPEFSLEAME
ncbi:MAG TPA: hypothetical protein PK747_09325 [Acidobacteriota bacterium]|jgi:rubrerythrin|nr:hypothetical protein [Acidobacteriota bacterium]HNT17161.1 hypothetical protein [Acidobacteriota bacterium]HPA27137.1 hypothetical protein [Acidobacteriota bacterium]HQO20788.1 hypothetical protein [Acidobacteriota bacterium]HQQ47593.1 hypothetical protein [Acidobacteriota bacterium]